MTGQREQNDPGRRFRRLGPSLLLLLFTLTVASFIGEIACRLTESLPMGLRWDWRESCIPAEEPALVYRLAPDLEKPFLALGEDGRLGIPLIDLLTPLAADGDPARFYLPDDPHPSPEGHRRFAELIAAGLERVGLIPLPPAGRGDWSEPQRVTSTPGNSHTAALHDRSMAFDGDGRTSPHPGHPG